MSKKPRSAPGPRRSRRPYAKPSLVVHGDLRAVTLVKKGNMGDGGGKPRTKASGGNA